MLAKTEATSVQRKVVSTLRNRVITLLLLRGNRSKQRSFFKLKSYCRKPKETHLGLKLTLEGLRATATRDSDRRSYSLRTEVELVRHRQADFDILADAATSIDSRTQREGLHRGCGMIGNNNWHQLKLLYMSIKLRMLIYLGMYKTLSATTKPTVINALVAGKNGTMSSKNPTTNGT